jgi:hypothetical protein
MNILVFIPWRPMENNRVIAHQRKIREEMALTNPRESASTLDGYSVETISRNDAIPIIMHYEWLRTIGRSTIFVGLLSPLREIEGVACFGWGPGGNIRRMIGVPALCLERGACVHYAPQNAASYLISMACKLVYRIHGVARFFAYADPMAGEYGAVYQAANWLYLGQGLDGGKGREKRWFVLAPGRDGDKPENWQTTRILRRQNPRLHLRNCEAAGWRKVKRGGKHVYAINVGRDRRRWRKERLHAQKAVHGGYLAYPAPYPELKRNPASARSQGWRRR